MLSVGDGDTQVVWAVRAAVLPFPGNKILSYLAPSDSWHAKAGSLNKQAHRNSSATPQLHPSILTIKMSHATFPLK